MKKILLIAALFSIVLAGFSQAGTRVVSAPTLNQGNFLAFGGVNNVGSDSLQVTDTIRYIIPVSHTNDVQPYYTLTWTKIGAGTATITQNWYQSNDNINWFPIQKGVAQTNYTKTFSPSATTAYEVDFAKDTARFNARYIQVQFITSATASVKGKIYNILKMNIK